MRKPASPVLFLSLAALFWVGTASIVAAPESVADAAKHGDLDKVRTLLARSADVDTAFGDGMTGLHWAARAGNTEMAELLLAAGADFEATTRIGAHTPLHVAAKAGRGPVVEILLEAGSDATATTSSEEGGAQGSRETSNGVRGGIEPV